MIISLLSEQFLITINGWTDTESWVGLRDLTFLFQS